MRFPPLYVGRRNNRTWPLTGFVMKFINLLMTSHTMPKAERWGVSTTTWVSVISLGCMMFMPSSVMWMTEMLSETRAVNTEQCPKWVFPITVSFAKHNYRKENGIFWFSGWSRGTVVFLPGSGSQCGRCSWQMEPWEHLMLNSGPPGTLEAGWRSISSQIKVLYMTSPSWVTLNTSPVKEHWNTPELGNVNLYDTEWF